MTLFFRYFLPITYFQATRLNRWDLVAYNALVEWIPAIGLSLYFLELSFRTISVVLLSYLAFICIYEIGYLTNDAISEAFEDKPRGRAVQFGTQKWVVWSLVCTRLIFWLAVTFLLGAIGNVVWLTFHATLLITFILHNSLPNQSRTATFFGLSTFRYLAPMILTLSPTVLGVLIPAVLLNNSLYRTTVYIRNKSIEGPEKPSIMSKFAFYAACAPLSTFLSLYFDSFLPVALCLYLFSVWLLYWLTSRIARAINLVLS